MVDVTGKTSNGCTYEGDYGPESAGRVHWSVIFRRNGDYAGMRHGVIHGMHGSDQSVVDAAVHGDIETIWTRVT